MIRRRFVRIAIGASLVVGGVATPGCSNDPGQPARESISAPRKGGGVQDAGAADKSKSTKPGGKLGSKSGAD
jgi:hypothetical protein